MKVLTHKPHTEQETPESLIGAKARREDGKEEAAQGRGMAEVVTLASLHQDRRDKKTLLLQS